MKNVKAMIKSGMIIETEGYIMFTTIHPLTKRLVAIPVIGGPVLEIEDNFDNAGHVLFWVSSHQPDDLNIVDVYKFNEDCEDEFNTLVFNNYYGAFPRVAVRKMVDEYVKDKILIKIA